MNKVTPVNTEKSKLVGSKWLDIRQFFLRFYVRDEVKV